MPGLRDAVRLVRALLLAAATVAAAVLLRNDLGVLVARTPGNDLVVGDPSWVLFGASAFALFLLLPLPRRASVGLGLLRGVAGSVVAFGLLNILLVVHPNAPAASPLRSWLGWLLLLAGAATAPWHRLGEPAAPATGDEPAAP